MQQAAEVAGHEIGTGAYTVYAQTASHLLGVAISRVNVCMGDSRLPPAMMALGSNNTATICNAVALACEEIRSELAAAAVADAQSPLAGRDAATLKLSDGTLRAPDGRSEPMAITVARLGGGMVEAFVGNEPKNVRPGPCATAR